MRKFFHPSNVSMGFEALAPLRRLMPQNEVQTVQSTYLIQAMERLLADDNGSSVSTITYVSIITIH